MGRLDNGESQEMLRFNADNTRGGGGIVLLRVASIQGLAEGG